MILNTGCTLKSLGKHYKNNTWARSHRFWFFKFPDKSCIQGWKAWRYTFVSLRPVDLNQHVQESSGELVKNVDYGAFTRVLSSWVSTMYFHIFKNLCNKFLLPRKEIGLHCPAVSKALLFISWLVSKRLSFSFVSAKNPHGHHFLSRGLKPTPRRLDFLLFSQCYFCTWTRLWQRVTRAINAKDQTEATQEKYVLEEAQRQAARERKTKNEEWTCRLFELDSLTGEWHYKFAE